MEISLPWAEDVSYWANWTLVGALLVGVLATYAIVVSSNAKERHWAEERRLSSERISANEKETARAVADSDKAREGVAKATEQAAMAIERAATLEKEAASARLETEKLKALVAWRTIPAAMAAELEKSLAANPGSVNLRYMDGDPEALFLAIQVSQILDKAKWRVAPGAVKPSNAIVFGISLPDATGPDAQRLRTAFAAAKIPFSTTSLPSDGVSFSISTIAGAPTLMIGSKAPPQIP